jgi:acetyltransferase-like isoleucine patch superfamily enzyme
MDFLRPEAFFDLESFRYRDLFSGCRYVWEALGNISTFTRERTIPGALGDVNVFGRPLPKTLVLWRGRVWDEGFELLGGDVTKGAFRVRIQGEETTEGVVLYAGSVLMDGQICLGAGSVVEPGALIKGPTLIGAYTEVRQGAYMRGKCIVGDRCVVGHTTEMKGSVMLDGAKAGHFAYIGDSILGRLSNLGAGTKLANLKIGGSEVSVRVQDELIGTGLRKFGAILGDNVELGCNSVTNPGTLIGKGSIVFPLTSVRACYYDPDSVIH